MAQQTAVDWLAHQVNSDCLNSTFIRPELIKEAKAMEKDQIIKAVDRGYDEGCKFPEDMTLKNSEQYYKETFTQGNE